MGNCIYFCDKSEELTYKKREHVFPAGLGGKHRLPKGYVSDQANELFSKYEFQSLRYSPLHISRATYGPGKRGSLNLQSVESPDVLSLKPFRRELDYNYVCPLGFLFQGQSYLLPQIVILFNAAPKDFEKMYLHPTYKDIEIACESNFEQKFDDFLLSAKMNYRLIEVPHKTSRHFACIGFYRDHWYVCSTQPNFSLDSCASRIFKKVANNTYPLDCFGTPPFDLAFKYSREIPLKNMVPVFIHCKTCFNVLAFFKGDTYVQQNKFDHFRHCIINNNDWNDVIRPNNVIPKEIYSWFKKQIHSHEHGVVIYTQNDSIMAVSTLYGKEWGHFILGTGHFGNPFSRAMICDFENQQEILYDADIPFL